MPVDNNAYEIMLCMDLEMNATYRALIAVGGYSIDRALDWLDEHQDDEDIHEPIQKEFYKK
jgi:uncharacterized UBP type Zn finger protein